MQIFNVILLGFLIVCAISVSFSKNLLNSILIFMSYSLIMSIFCYSEKNTCDSPGIRKGGGR